MASEVFSTEDITLLDGVDVELKPLAIVKLRKFMRIWNEHMAGMQERIKKQLESNDEAETAAEEISEADLTDAQFDMYIKLCIISLESQLKGDKTDKQFKDYLESVLDEETIYRILEKTGGLRLGGNPNLQTGTANLAPDGMN